MSPGCKIVPSRSAWVATASVVAKEFGVSPEAILDRKNRGRVCSNITYVRWVAWAAMLRRNPNYSIAGLARTSNYTHGAILRGLKKLRESDRVWR